ncbi:hypothetical protein BB561_003150 [Smittium simulii]|uniref:Uncharacterized protein n=2 Tax=Smittium simulii TaxID=133385 RepID=A0A2T9YML1_9FUNG|nr:hypothetical protein BB561_003150 [Smittium simulii]
MNQDNLISLIGDLAEQVRLLRMENTETQKAVKQLQREENNTPQTELPHVVPRAPVADLIFFPELSEANPLAEEDFFRNPLTEEELLIKNFFHDSEPLSIKKICFGGSDKKIGWGYKIHKNADFLRWKESQIILDSIAGRQNPENHNAKISASRRFLIKSKKFTTCSAIIDFSDFKIKQTPFDRCMVIIESLEERREVD